MRTGGLEGGKKLLRKLSWFAFRDVSKAMVIGSEIAAKTLQKYAGF